MTMNADSNKLSIGYGRRTFPDDVKAVWGARLIWPNDLVWDRQDLDAHSDEDKQALISWLNGNPEGNGAIKAMKLALTTPSALGLSSTSDTEAVIFEDETGKIIGSAQSSYGYLYVAGWLK